MKINFFFFFLGLAAFILVPIVVALVVGFLVAGSLIGQNLENTVFYCEDQKSIAAKFESGNDTRITLILSDGRELSLPKTLSVNGTKYATPDESFVFWMQDDAAFITEHGEQTFKNCTVVDLELTPEKQTASDGPLTLSYADYFAVAKTKEEMTGVSYIPPCDENFTTCFYYKADTYKGTNFGSAGLRLEKRINFSTEKTCLETPPAGFDTFKKPDTLKPFTAYAMSKFSDIGQGAAGHYSSGSLYRLYIRGSSECYEFETRITESQFANYPEGSIKLFSDQDKERISTQLEDILQSAKIDGKPLQLP